MYLCKLLSSSCFQINNIKYFSTQERISDKFKDTVPSTAADESSKHQNRPAGNTNSGDDADDANSGDDADDANFSFSSNGMIFQC